MKLYIYIYILVPQDAVDPNAHEVLGKVAPNGCGSMRVENVRSIAHEKGLHADIIDLC